MLYICKDSYKNLDLSKYENIWWVHLNTKGMPEGAMLHSELAPSRISYRMYLSGTTDVAMFLAAYNSELHKGNFDTSILSVLKLSVKKDILLISPEENYTHSPLKILYNYIYSRNHEAATLV